MKTPDTWQDRAERLRLHGLIAHWEDAVPADWVGTLIEWEEAERARRSLERRLLEARIGRFKPLADFDWSWPKRVDRAAFEALMNLQFLKEATNVVLVGSNGVGKSTLARILAHAALLAGHTVRFATAGALLGELAALDSDSALRRRKTRFFADIFDAPLHIMFEHGLRMSEFAQARRNYVKLEDKRIKIMRLNGSRSTEHPLSGNAIKRDAANRPENQAARRRRSDSASRKPAA